jgi:hypothetical protein
MRSESLHLQAISSTLHGATVGGFPRGLPAMRMHVCSAVAQQILSRVGEAVMNACLRRGYGRSHEMSISNIAGNLENLSPLACSRSAISPMFAQYTTDISLDTSDVLNYFDDNC